LGLELIDVQQNDIQGGSIVGIAQRKWGCRPVLPSVENFIVAERDMNLQSPEVVKEFSQKLTSIRTEISRFTQAEKKQGKRFWGFGAARSGTTLMAQLDLGNVIERIVDDNPSKQNKFTPLYGIPVVATEHLYHEKPDFAFILAWIHASKIVASHQRYLEEGGKFITCFPRPCIIGNTGIVPL
jgi:hypothetical protein